MLLRTNRSRPRSDDFTIRAAEIMFEVAGIRPTDELILAGAVRLLEKFHVDRRTIEGDQGAGFSRQTIRVHQVVRAPRS